MNELPGGVETSLPDLSTLPLTALPHLDDSVLETALLSLLQLPEDHPDGEWIPRSRLWQNYSAVR